MSRISEQIGVYPSEISPARYNFLLLSCVTIPIGFILANVFLQLYFKFDGGYFSSVNIQYHYKKGQMLREPHRRYCVNKLNSIACCKCCKGNLLQPELMGDWVDISSQEENKNDLDNDSFQESEIETRLNLNQSERIVFDEVKKSIPYYRLNL